MVKCFLNIDVQSAVSSQQHVCRLYPICRMTGAGGSTAAGQARRLGREEEPTDAVCKVEFRRNLDRGTEETSRGFRIFGPSVLAPRGRLSAQETEDGDRGGLLRRKGTTGEHPPCRRGLLQGCVGFHSPPCD